MQKLKIVINQFFVFYTKLIVEVVRRQFGKSAPRSFVHPMDFVGGNWREEKPLPIAVCFGFNEWKRQIVSSYLPEYKTAFVRGNAWYLRVSREFFSHLPREQEIVFVAWGSKLPRWAREYVRMQAFFRRRRISVLTMEDGFLRSMGAGLLHSRPASQCVDKNGIYFDATQPSDLEQFLQAYDFTAHEGLIARAHVAMALMRAGRLTKYYDSRPYDDSKKLKKTGRYSILVVGQVEDDASILKGLTKIDKNHELIRQARKDHPEADIFFRPHPDYWSGIRRAKKKLRNIERICAVVEPDTSLFELFEVVDHVYTMTSLTGFEALVHGLKVTTFGMPFYAGWGVTDDRAKLRRRKKKLSVEEIFAVAYLVYPRYLHPLSDEFVAYEEVASHFLVESLRYENIFSLSESNRLFDHTKAFAQQLSAPFRLMVYLNETGDFSAADTARVLEITETGKGLADYLPISQLLIRTSNYDALVQYSNRCIGVLEANPATLVANTTLFEGFLYGLTLSQLNSNGRVIRNLPDLNGFVCALPTQDRNFSRILKNYIRCLSSNLQYGVIESLLRELKRREESPVQGELKRAHWRLNDIIADAMGFQVYSSFYRTIGQVLLQKPARSERNSDWRHRLVSESLEEYGAMMDVKYPQSVDLLFNKSILWMLKEDAEQAAAEFSRVLSVVIQKNADGETQVSPPASLVKRRAEWLGLGSFFVKKGRFSLVDAIFDIISDRDDSSTFLKLSYLKGRCDWNAFFALYETLDVEKQESERFLGLYARSMRELGFYERARAAYEKIARTAQTVAKRSSIEAEVDKLKFIPDTDAILNSVPQPRLPKGVVFLASQTCFNTMAMLAPCLVELKKKGYAVVNLTEGMGGGEPVGLSFIDRFRGAIGLKLSAYSISNEWNVDWEARRVVAKGINFYQGFYERVSTAIRRFHVDVNMPVAREAFFSYLERADLCLSVCEDIYKEVVGRGIPVSFVTGNSHVVPFSIFRDFARHKNHPLLNFINANVAYESYFSNLGSKFANTMCVTDMTLYPNIRAPFMARRDQFEKWYENNEGDSRFVEKASALINVNRVGSLTNDREQEIVRFLVKSKAEGKKIVCAFGKVPVDLNVPYDGGPAHRDMADWISHTVEVCGGAENIVLLVKPHPHELRPEIALDLVESFHDLITADVRDNVLLLGHKDINGHALAPHLDLAILYNGSTGPEMTAQGIPVMMTSHFGKHDYPVDLLYPESREGYAEFLLSGNYPPPSDETRKRAAFLMCYLGTEEISILNQYSIRQLTNDKIGVPRWRREKVDRFLREGDDKMRLIADRIVEKFEKQRNSIGC